MEEKDEAAQTWMEDCEKNILFLLGSFSVEAA